jgi:hypothetical protein
MKEGVTMTQLKSSNWHLLVRGKHAGRSVACGILGWVALSGALWAQQAPRPILTPPKVPSIFVHEHKLPARFINPPRLPSVAGCFTLGKDNKTWEKDTCVPQEYVRAHYPHPELEPGVQFGKAATAGSISPMPVTGGAIDVGLMTFGGENDPTWGNGEFSVQLNTNAYTDSSNHAAAVQFVTMHKPTSATQSEDLVCIWSVDITAQNYPNTCHSIITGRNVQAGDFVAIQGRQDFQDAGYLKMTFQLSWDSQEGTYGVVALDQFGLTQAVNKVGNWNQLTGSILGYGNGSEAQFSKTSLWIAIDTWNCEYDANNDCTGFDPGPWTWPATKPFVALNGLTEETNNLTPPDTYTNSTPASSLPALQTPGWNGSYIEYTATAP